MEKPSQDAGKTRSNYQLIALGAVVVLLFINKLLTGSFSPF